MQILKEANYPQIIIDTLEDALVRKALQQILLLATFEFDEEEPRRLTPDVNHGYAYSVLTNAWRENEEQRILWNQRKRAARQRHQATTTDNINAFARRILASSPWTPLLRLLQELALFEFPGEPQRLTIHDVNPGNYAVLGPADRLEQDAATFLGHWSAWNQQRTVALNSKKAAIRSFFNGKLSLVDYPEIADLLNRDYSAETPHADFSPTVAPASASTLAYRTPFQA